jgi:hypothetical protein
MTKEQLEDINESNDSFGSDSSMENNEIVNEGANEK